MMKNPKLVKPRPKQDRPAKVENNAFAAALAGLNLESKNEEVVEFYQEPVWTLGGV